MARVAIEPGLLALPERESDPPRLLGSRCQACGTTFHPPRPVCLACHARSLDDVALSGRGTVYACTHVQMPLRPSRRERRDYWVAVIDLDDGPRVQGILSPDVVEPRIGMRVGVALETLRSDDEGDETVVHHFREEGGAA